MSDNNEDTNVESGYKKLNTSQVNELSRSICEKEECKIIHKLEKKELTVIVFGASGDLAKKKTFPSLYGLFCFGLLPQHVNIVGYARSDLQKEKLIEMFRPACLEICNEEELFSSFCSRVTYLHGPYDSEDHFVDVSKKIAELENHNRSNRVFYLALPPSIFSTVVHAFHPSCMTTSGWNRVVVEKPFGRDSETSKVLVQSLSDVLKEEEQYRIDHYLGKEMVQNLMVLRFSNLAFQPLWNRNYIKCVMITFKENFGTEGRGGYFDNIGIIRDVMQNHLMQVLSLVAMERPVSLSSEDVRDEKVKVLKSILPINFDDVVIGQYTSSILQTANGDKRVPGYTDDPTVPLNSICATFATVVLHINNERWAGVPFILKCGKALSERKAEIRMQFNDVPGQLFPSCPRNELVIRIQPNESTYLKLQVKSPGLEIGTTQAELDLFYPTRYSDVRLPDAYERLLFDVLKGDQSQFVRADELEVAWRIFTPLLHYLENNQVRPHPYPYGSRGPSESDELIRRYGYSRSEGYTWKDPRTALKSNI